MKKLSGLQKDVLSLYRTLLREAAKKDLVRADENVGTTSTSSVSFAGCIHQDGTSLAYARREFRKQAMDLKRSDFKMIEFKIRQAKKQIKLLQMPGVKIVGGT